MKKITTKLYPLVPPPSSEDRPDDVLPHANNTIYQYEIEKDTAQPKVTWCTRNMKFLFFGIISIVMIIVFVVLFAVTYRKMQEKEDYIASMPNERQLQNMRMNAQSSTPGVHVIPYGDENLRLEPKDVQLTNVFPDESNYIYYIISLYSSVYWYDDKAYMGKNKVAVQKDKCNASMPLCDDWCKQKKTNTAAKYCKKVKNQEKPGEHACWDTAEMQCFRHENSLIYEKFTDTLWTYVGDSNGWLHLRNKDLQYDLIFAKGPGYWVSLESIKKTMDNDDKLNTKILCDSIPKNHTVMVCGHSAGTGYATALAIFMNENNYKQKVYNVGTGVMSVTPEFQKLINEKTNTRYYTFGRFGNDMNSIEGVQDQRYNDYKDEETLWDYNGILPIQDGDNTYTRWSGRLWPAQSLHFACDLNITKCYFKDKKPYKEILSTAKYGGIDRQGLPDLGRRWLVSFYLHSFGACRPCLEQCVKQGMFS
jgi:hypothetical protein